MVVPKERINLDITARQVRLIDVNGKQKGIVSIDEALMQARLANLDLVEISPKINPPVCKITDFGKFHYQKERKFRESKKNQHIVQIKEIKMGPLTEEHDYNFKIKNAIKFFKQKNKVKFTVRFKGRQIVYKEKGYDLLQRLKTDLLEYAEVDTEPVVDRRTVFMIMAPKK